MNIRAAIELIEGLGKPPEIKDFSGGFSDDKIVSRIQGQAARKNPAWKRSLVKAMKKYGFELVGNGLNGAVFRNPKYRFVLKVYRHDPAYDEWFYFALKHQSNRFVPKIRGRIIRLNKIFSAVRLEPLVPCPNDKAIAFIHEVERVQHALSVTLNKEPIRAKEDPDIFAIARFMYDWESHSDLTPHNVMCREDGGVVLIDPIHLSGYGS